MAFRLSIEGDMFDVPGPPCGVVAVESHTSSRRSVVVVAVVLLVGALVSPRVLRASEGGVELPSEYEFDHLDARVREGLPLRDAAMLFLGERAGKTGGIRVRPWVRSDGGRGLKLRWRPDDSEAEWRVARFEVEGARPVAASDSARRLVGRGFELARAVTVDVFPSSYHPTAPDGEVPWRGQAGHACQLQPFAANCRLMHRFFSRTRQASLIGRLVGVFVESSADFWNHRREEGDCSWNVQSPIRDSAAPGWATHRIDYTCGGASVRWNYELESMRGVALDGPGRLAAVLSTVRGASEPPRAVEIRLAEYAEAIRGLATGVEEGE